MDITGRPMIARYEQVELFSPEEYRRRIDGIRGILRDHDADLVVFCECAEEAYDQWLTGRRMLECMVVFAGGDVVGMPLSEFDRRGIAPESAVDYSQYRMQKDWDPPCENISFRPAMTGTQLAEWLKSFAPSRIGVVLPQLMTREWKAGLRESLPDAELVDLTIPAALFRAVKSGEEMAAIRMAMDAQIRVYEAMGQMIRPGRNVRDIETELQYLMLEQGASGVVHAHLICDGPQNEPSFLHKYDDHVIERGDRFFALMEANGPGGQHICFGRCMTLGEPTKELVKVYEDATALHRFAVARMRPGTTLREIALRTGEFARELGYEMRQHHGWNWMHSLGGYYYEQYSLEDYTDCLPLREGVLLHCHPVLFRTFPHHPEAREEIFVLNAYRVGQDGQEDLCGLPFGIRILD